MRVLREELDVSGFKLFGNGDHGPWSEEQYKNAYEWLKDVRRTKNINKRHTSYGWKHIASNSLRKKYGNGDDGKYISNGAFIAAAMDLGFVVRQCYINLIPTPNAWINISETARKY